MKIRPQQWFVVFSFILSLPGAALASEAGHPKSPDFPRGEEPIEPPSSHYRNTYYYVVLESEYQGQRKNVKVLDLQGRTLAVVSPHFKKAMDIEGTGRLEDGRVLNFAGVRQDGTRYLITNTPFGLGIGSCQLIPFRTVAVDGRKIPLGSLVRIDETVGMVLPDGTVHDGYWRAEDIGGAIKEQRIDLFVGDGNQGEVLTRHGITHLQPLNVTVVREPSKDSCANDITF